MGQIKWYKRDPSAALNGMMELTLEERGAYNTVLDLIYSRDGNLPDDDRFIAGWLMVDVRVWKRIKSKLLDREKLFVEGGKLRNARADEEVLAALGRVGSAREAGLASAASKAGKAKARSRKNSDLASTDVETDDPTTVSTNHSHNQREETDVSSDVRESADTVVTRWNAMAEPLGLAKCNAITAKRMPSFKARAKDIGIPAILQAIDRIPGSPFLRGEKGGWGGATIDFLLRPDSVTKILEGKYDDRAKSQQPRSGDGSVEYLLNRLQAGGSG